jgi:hypothetical protein
MNRVSKTQFWFLVILLSLSSLLFYSSSAKAAENISEFVSDISLNRDASADITETITVNAESKYIRHGLMRQLLRSWRDSNGATHDANYQDIKVWRDSASSDFHLSSAGNALAIYIGSAGVLLSPGVYTYQIKYHTSNAVIFEKNQDEFYWNITGNAWQFPIDHVTAIIHLPDNANILQYTGYTGPLGSKAHDDVATLLPEGGIRFSTTTILQPGEGFTAAIAFPKGIIHSPTPFEKIKSNRENWIALEITFLLIFYYLLIWFLMAREPASGTIIPLFEPPLGVSPAAMRYIKKMSFDQQTFAIAIISMASKNFLKIEEIDKQFTLLKNKDGDKSQLSAGEKDIADALFDSREFVSLQPKNSQQVQSAFRALVHSLHHDYDNIYFVTNLIYLIPGYLFSFLGVGIIFLLTPGLDISSAFFLTVGIFIWTLVCYAIVINMVRSWLRVLRGDFSSLGGAISLLFTAIVLVGCGIVSLYFFSYMLSFFNACFICLLLAMNIIFTHVLKVYTLTGRKIMDQIDGFKLFLSVTEKDRFDQLNPPEKTPALFEKYLPYAMALDISQDWSNQFTEVLNQASIGQEAYRPSWYVGDSWSNMNMGMFTDNLASNLASSQTPVSSGSSASDGDGCSGGGGGGGGGGGW